VLGNVAADCDEFRQALHGQGVVASLVRVLQESSSVRGFVALFKGGERVSSVGRFFYCYYRWIYPGLIKATDGMGIVQPGKRSTYLSQTFL